MGTRVYLLVSVLLLSMLIWGCESQRSGFALPEGYIKRGEVAYAELLCQACHSRVDSPSLNIEGIDVRLGGRVTKVDSYAKLVTSIINPSHRIRRVHAPAGVLPDGESAMQNYNEWMTVQQLVDLVAMLRAEYEVERPDYPYIMYF